MAYWYIRFKSRDGNTYEARITGKTGNTNVQLQGAESPFTTEEKDTDSMFEPVITQSGYLQIEDNGYDLAGNAFDWHDLVPQNSTDRSVVLYKQQQNNTWVDVWGGYIQPRTFDGEYLAYGQTRKFPLMCHLSQLESEEVNPELYETANIAKILYYLTDGFATEYVFQGEDAISEWLKIRINWSVFADIEEVMDAQGGIGVELKPKMNKLEALEGICKFFGWTCRIKARTLYFASPDSSIASLNWQSINDEGLISIADGETAPTPTTVNWDLYEMEDNPFASDDNDEYYLPGIKKATITADVGEQENLPSQEDEEFKNYFEKFTSNPPYIHNGDGYYFYVFDSDVEIKTKNTIFKFNEIDSEAGIAGLFRQYDFWNGDNLTKKHNYNWTQQIEVHFGNRSGAVGEVFSMQSRFPHSFPSNSLIAFSGTTFHTFFNIDGDGHCTLEKWRGQGYLICSLKIGDYYWDGAQSQWIQSANTIVFEIPVGTEESEYKTQGQIIDNRVLNGPYMPYNGYGIPIATGIGGIVKFSIFGYRCTELYSYSQYQPLYNSMSHSLNIQNLKLELVQRRADTLANTNEQNTYTAESGQAFEDESEENVIFASNNNNKIGTSIIMNDNLAYVEKLTYSEFGGSHQEHPEQQLANRMAAWGNKTRKVLNLELDRADIPDIAPTNKIADYDSTEYYPLVLKRDWREGQTTIKMFEL